MTRRLAEAVKSPMPAPELESSLSRTSSEE